jgi:hypothetical protein
MIEEAGKAATLSELGDMIATNQDLCLRVHEAEAARRLLADVLALPRVRFVLSRIFHPDKHPGATEAERKAICEALATVNTAYEILERDT